MVTSYVKINIVHGGRGGEGIGTGELSIGSKTGITLFSRMTRPLVFQLIFARIVDAFGCKNSKV